MEKRPHFLNVRVEQCNIWQRLQHIGNILIGNKLVSLILLEITTFYGSSSGLQKTVVQKVLTYIMPMKIVISNSCNQIVHKFLKNV